MIEKPKFGQPCNGCGMCCVVEPCKLANDVMNCTTGPCKALEIEAGRKVCGLIKRPAWYMFGKEAPFSETGWLSVIFANALGIGRGCDADDKETPDKGDFDGSMVAETCLVDPQKVIDCCKDDVIRTREIYKRITFS